MAYNNADMAFTLPNQITPSQVLQQGIQLKERATERADALAERQRQFDERERDRAEAAKYKQAEFVDKNTTIPQSVLTGSGKYGAIANDQVGKLTGKYFGMLANGVPQSKVQTAMSQEVPQVVASLNSAKGELEGIDKSVKYLQEKDKYGEDLDAQKLRQDLIDDVEKRHIDPKTGLLVNPVNITPSQLQQGLSNPDNLAKYLKGTTGVEQYFKENTKKDKVFVKNGEGQYVYKAPNLPYATGNWNTGQPIQPEGFKPQYSIKGHEVPTPHLDNQLGEGTYPPIKVLDDEAYKSFLDAGSHHEAYLSKMAQDEYGAKNWASFNEHAKDIAKKQVAYKLAEKGVQNNLPTMDDIIKPPRTNITNQANKDVTFNDVSTQLDNALPEKGIAPLTQMPSEARVFLSKSVNEGRREDDKFDISKLGVVKGFDGTYRVVNMDKSSNDSKDEVVGIFSRTGVNLGTNKGGQKVQQKIIKDTTPKVTSKESKSEFSSEQENMINQALKVNKGATREQIISAARKAGKL